METNKGFFEKLNESFRQSATVKLIAMTILVLLLLIPKSMINSLILEREGRMHEAVREVTEKWSEQQTITGPVIVIPYKTYYQKEDGTTIKSVHNAYFLPEDLTIDGDLQPEKRYRGIFDVVVYRSHLSVRGMLPNFDFSTWNIDSSEVMWDHATLNLGITDLRGVEEAINLKLGNEKIAFEPGAHVQDIIKSGVHVNLKNHDMKKEVLNFQIEMSLKGSEGLYFIPVGKETFVNLTSYWPDPSFSGAFIPKNRSITPAGFNANWKVLHFNRNYPQQWTDQSYDMAKSRFGVDLFVAADHYQKSMRSSKYAILVITLTFLVFFLIEVINKIRIHPFQYILIGLALCVFYTLLLSIAEQLGFNTAYGIAAASVIILIALYVKAIISNKRIAMALAALLGVLYGFIFVIIQMESYSLLVGSIGLFLIIGLTMYFTRKINWYTASETSS